jgi:hypothetical protein
MLTTLLLFNLRKGETAAFNGPGGAMRHINVVIAAFLLMAVATVRAQDPQVVFLSCAIDGTADGGQQYIGITLQVAFIDSPATVWFGGRQVKRATVSSTEIAASGFDDRGGSLRIDRLSGRFIWGG